MRELREICWRAQLPSGSRDQFAHGAAQGSEADDDASGLQNSKPPRFVRRFRADVGDDYSSAKVALLVAARNSSLKPHSLLENEYLQSMNRNAEGDSDGR